MNAWYRLSSWFGWLALLWNQCKITSKGNHQWFSHQQLPQSGSVISWSVTWACLLSPHAVKVCEAVLTLDILNNKLELTESNLIILEVSQWWFKHTFLKTIGSNFSSSSLGHHSFADLSDSEHGRSLDIVPIFFGEGIDDLLFWSLFSSWRADSLHVWHLSYASPS